MGTCMPLHVDGPAPVPASMPASARNTVILFPDKTFNSPIYTSTDRVEATTMIETCVQNSQDDLGGGGRSAISLNFSPRLLFFRHSNAVLKRRCGENIRSQLRSPRSPALDHICPSEARRATCRHRTKRRENPHADSRCMIGV